MKRAKGILPKQSDLDERVRGDALGVAADWHSLEGLADATRKRYEEDPSDAAKQRYLKIIEAMLPLLGVEGSEGFRRRHHELVAQLAPGSRVEKALGDVPSLGPEPDLQVRLAERLDLDGYEAPEGEPEDDPAWVEHDEPWKTSGAPRIPGDAKAA